MHVLTAARWPGNVRQLRNVMERLVVTVMDDAISAEKLPPDLNPAAGADSEVVLRTLAEVTEEAEKDAIAAALAASDYPASKPHSRLGSVCVRCITR
jgi:two-component system NtrC family response regulator